MQKNYWWKEAKIYELYVDKFAVDFPGLTTRLPYLVALGINTVHLLPFFPTGGVDDGYDVTDYRDVRPELGRLADFEAFLKAAHEAGIRVIIDLVINHTSDLHPWFREAAETPTSPKRDYYLWSKEPKGYDDAANAFPDMKSSNWVLEPQTGEYFFATFYPQQPDLNWKNPAVEREMLDIMDYWVSRGVDGFRLDAAAHLIKREQSPSKGLPETHQVLKRLRAHIDMNYPDVLLLAEANQSISATKEYFGDGDECHMAYNFPLMQAMWLSIMMGDNFHARAAIAESMEIPENCQWATFLRSHDELSLEGIAPTEHDALLKFLDPEGQYLFKFGHSTSVRVATALKGDDVKIREAFSLLYSLPGAPIMYYGDEIKMHNLPKEHSVPDSRIYVRGNFEWNEAELMMKDQLSVWTFLSHLIRSTPTPTMVASSDLDKKLVAEEATESSVSS